MYVYDFLRRCSFLFLVPSGSPLLAFRLVGKRPAAAVAPAVVAVGMPSKSAAIIRPAAAPATVATVSRKRPASACDDIEWPEFSLRPTHWAGGRIYHHKGKHCFRAYARAADKVEAGYGTYPKGGTEAEMQAAFKDACKFILDDPRPP